MNNRNWKKELLTIPNLLSLVRLALIPLYISIYMNARGPETYFLAGSILAVSCLTDLIDGQVARHFNMVTTVGKILDPLADKLTQLALIICLAVKYPVLNLVLILFLVKEIFQTTAMVIMYHRGKMLPGSLLPGKICSFFLFSSFTVMIIIPDFNTNAIVTIALVDTIFLLYALVGYYLAYFGKHPKLEDVN